MAPLNTLREGQTGTVRSMDGGERFISRATAMGFIPNTQITML